MADRPDMDDAMPEITDMESLTAWLETRPREDAITIVHRVAMRVAPIWYAAMDEPWAGENDLTSLPVLRSSLISGAARENPAPEIIAAAHAAFIAARAAAIAYATATSTPDAAPAPAATVAADAIAYATSTAISFTPAPFAGEAAYPAAYATAVTAATTAFWPAVQHDARAILDGHDPLDLPLWPATNPLADEWTRSQPILRNTPGGAFWIDWYQRALDGRPQNWPLLRDVALIDDAIWESGGGALDQAISQHVERHRLLDEVSRLRRDLLSAQAAASSTAHRGHNNPPELLDPLPEVQSQIATIDASLAEAEEELTKPQPSAHVLRRAARAIGAAVKAVLGYCASLADITLKESAKNAGATAGKWAPGAAALYLASQLEQFRQLVDALLQFVNRLP